MNPTTEKTFHLKWNNHLQNLSQLFTSIYSSSSLADVTLACRDGSLRAHKLVLSACSPYFEQIFKDNPCKHPVVILKGIPFSEINLLVEFMYKGSVDVQEIDLQSLMHTASELEIRGLAYEVRPNAAQLLNVNLNEYPAYGSSQMSYNQVMPRTDMERLKQIHMYQQSMIRQAELAKFKRREEQNSTAVKSILAAAAKEMADGRERSASVSQIEEGQGTIKSEVFLTEEEVISRPKKRVSFATPEDETQRRKMQLSEEDGISKVRITAVSGATDGKEMPRSSSSGIKVVSIESLKSSNDQHNTDDDENGGAEDDDSCSSSGEENSSEVVRDNRPHVCDICDIRFQRASHLSRHRLTHTGERPFVCGGCGKTFARSDKLRVHTKICEREDPTVDISDTSVQADSPDIRSGMVRVTHKDSRQLMFTPSGDVILAPRPPGSASSTTATPSTPTTPSEPKDSSASSTPDMPVKRGRGRPKKIVPDLPKIPKRRGRPPKALQELEMMMGNGGFPAGLSLASVSGLYKQDADVSGTVSLQQTISPTGEQLVVKRKRGRPPKNYFQPLSTYADVRPKENYNATNLPFGDFSYLTDMMYAGGMTGYSYPNVTAVDPEQDVDMDAPAQPHASGEQEEEKNQEDIQKSTSDEDFVEVQCRTTIHIGSYKFVPKDKVQISSKGIRIVAPSLVDGSDVSLQIKSEDIFKILVHNSKTLPVIFLYTLRSCASYIRNSLGMSEESELGYYDPMSKDDQLKKITILPEVISDEIISLLEMRFSGTMDVINMRDAIDILVRTFPKKDELLAQAESSKAHCSETH